VLYFYVFVIRGTTTPGKVCQKCTAYDGTVTFSVYRCSTGKVNAQTYSFQKCRITYMVRYVVVHPVCTWGACSLVPRGRDLSITSILRFSGGPQKSARHKNFARCTPVCRSTTIPRVGVYWCIANGNRVEYVREYRTYRHRITQKKLNGYVNTRYCIVTNLPGYLSL
jgi:hypothetical protein